MGDFGAQWPACASPCQLLRVQPRGYPHLTRGHNGAASPFKNTLKLGSPKANGTFERITKGYRDKQLLHLAERQKPDDAEPGK
jgi:hypothetical protein